MQSPFRCLFAAPPPASILKTLRKAGQSSRSFSTSPQHSQRVARHRRALYTWLHAQGENFRNPLPGSTNYISSYNNSGQLLRLMKDGDPSGASKAGGDRALPPAQGRDLQPFPQNRLFMSQPVLSEELRHEIWKRIMVSGKSVREVSAELGVEMHRVGAVVRLVEVEKEWQRIVSLDHLCISYHSPLLE